MILLAGGLTLILAGAVTSFVFRRRAFGDALYRLLVISGCVLCGASAVAALLTQPVDIVSTGAGVSGGRWSLGMDLLSAAFVVVIALIGMACTAYGTAYMASEREQRPVWFAHSVFAVLLAALVVVVIAQAIMPFLIAWETMAIASFLLIVTDHERQDARRAGLIYLVATHTGTLSLLGMFAIWGARASDWSFASLSAAAGQLPAGGTAILILGGIGFGLKAGIVPFHFWLPPAHAAAPSHVSAMLSGVVIKTGVYGLLRVTTMLGAAPAWWGWVILALGIASGVLGVLWALAQHDLKRLLAYHSVENIGIILMGVGIGVLGTSSGHSTLAVIGYAGALLHTLNHALFKSLLFLGAGAVQRTTGTRGMDALGGLAHRMPYTWVAFLVGATAIIGVPPLNGFVSEWLVYQGLFRAGHAEDVTRLALLGVPALALIGALALACFAKVAGVVFLGHPRTPGAAAAGEVSRALLTPMIALAITCVVFGVAAPLGMAPALRVAATLSGATSATIADAAPLVIDAAWIGAIAGVLVALVVAGWFARNALQRRRPLRMAETWACGYETPNARMQYTASSFAAPLLSAFGRVSGVRRERAVGSFHTHVRDLVLDGWALPLWEALRRAALRLRPLQQGRLYAYLIYVLAALFALLVYVAVEVRRLR